jgi:hypothetical protein
MALLRSSVASMVSACALAFLGAGAGGANIAAPDLAPYSGLGTWISIYSSSFRTDADRLAAGLAQRGVETLFVETGNFRQRVDVVGRSQLGALIDAAHAQGLAVIAWYLPDLTNVGRDLRRARAAISLRTPSGDRFDSFALDIESSAVRNSSERNRRLLELSRRLRAAVGSNYALGAIIPSPVGMKLLPRYWPHFPYAALARSYDVFLPMAYFTYRAHGRSAVSRYIQTSVRIIRGESGDATIPIHVIGGLAARTGAADAGAFVQATASCGVDGFSLYDYGGTKISVWPLLERAARLASSGARC